MVGKRSIKIGIFLLSLVIALVSCDKKEVLLIDGKLSKKEFITPCGSVKLEVYTVAVNHLFVKYIYSLTKELTIYKDSLTVFYKGDNLPFSMVCSKDNCEGSIFKLSGNGYLKLEFKLNTALSKGDTIYLQSNGFVYCDNQKIPIDSLYLIIGDK